MVAAIHTQKMVSIIRSMLMVKWWHFKMTELYVKRKNYKKWSRETLWAHRLWFISMFLLETFVLTPADVLLELWLDLFAFYSCVYKFSFIQHVKKKLFFSIFFSAVWLNDWSFKNFLPKMISLTTKRNWSDQGPEVTEATLQSTNFVYITLARNITMVKEKPNGSRLYDEVGNKV